MQSRAMRAGVGVLVVVMSATLVAACGGGSESLPLPDNLPTRNPTSRLGAGPPRNALPVVPPREVLSISGQCEPPERTTRPVPGALQAPPVDNFAFAVDPFCIIWTDNSGLQPAEYLITLTYEHSDERFEHRVPGHVREFFFPAEESLAAPDLRGCTLRSGWSINIFAVMPDSNVLVSGMGMGGFCETLGQTPQAVQ